MGTTFLTPTSDADPLPALSLAAPDLELRDLTAAAAQVTEHSPEVTLVLDARRRLLSARQICQEVARTSPATPVLLVVDAGGLPVVDATWGGWDIVVDTASPAEFQARLRLLPARRPQDATGDDAGAGTSALGDGADPIEDLLVVGDLVIDPAAYTARLRGRSLDLAFREFELLKHLASFPGRAFTRSQLLDEVWGFDYFGGPRTVDVHVRRLRAKLGPEYDFMLATVRNVGYRFVEHSPRSADSRPQ